MTYLSRTQTALSEEKVDALLLTNPINIFYLTGFKGLSQTEREALVVVGSRRATLITARLYQAEAQKLASQSLTIKIAAERDEYINLIKQAISKHKRVGFEASDLKYAEYIKFKKYTRPNKFVPTKDLLEKLRQIKSDIEIKSIEKAQIISQRSFTQLVKTIRVGQTEQEISDKLIAIMKSLGSLELSFDPIVASGPNSALPHYLIGRRKIKKGDTLLLDFGAKHNDYCADLSRTIFIGKATSQQKNIYIHVQKAQKTGFEKVKNNVKAKEVAKSVNNYFKKLGLDKYFIHSLGHGVGLEIHEKPSLSVKSKDTLKKGMVFSIEPGLYFPWGGVRIEDLFTISPDKAQMFGPPSQFIEI